MHLEGDLFYLAEAFGWSEEVILGMSISRRKRAIAWCRANSKAMERKLENKGDDGSFTHDDLIDIWGRAAVHALGLAHGDG